MSKTRDSDAPTWLVIANYVVAAQGALTGPIVARLLGPEGRGQSAALLTVAIVVATLASLGVPAALTGRAAVFSLPALVAATRSFRWIILLLSLWIIPALYIVAKEVSIPNVGLLLIFGVPMVLGNFATGVRTGILIATGHFRRVCAIKVGSAVSLIVALTVISLTTVNVEIITGAYLVALTVPGIVPLPKQTSVTSRQEVEKARSVIRSDMPALTAQSVLNISNARADQAILPLALSNRDLGFYSVAVTYSTLAGPLNAAIAILIMRRMGRQGQTSATFPWRAAGALIFASVALAAGANFIIPLLFGNSFVAAVQPAVIMCLASIIIGLSTIMAGMLIAAGRTNRIIVGEILTVLLLPLTIPISTRYGSTGAAAAASVSYLANFLYLVYVVTTSRTVTRRRPANDVGGG